MTVEQQSSNVMQPPISTTTPSTRILTPSGLTDDSGTLRIRARQLSQEVDQVHRDSIVSEWQSSTTRHGKLAASTNLDKLAALGFGWRDVATMVGVSVPALQKWRRGEGITGENRRRIASLVAACELITEHYLIEEIASWFEMPIVDNVSVTAVDLWASDRTDLVFEVANGHADPEAVLTDFDPQWRDHYESAFESFVGEDGMISLRPRS